MKAPRKFATEADLCAAFIAWVGRTAPEVKYYAEWAGWDILLVYPEGWQLGIQAKLRLNADVILQAAPNCWYGSTNTVAGPDYRGILVPDRNGWAEVAGRLGLLVFYPRESFRGQQDFLPDLWERWAGHSPVENWLDWNPAKRHELPPVPTDAIAGSPCPVSLTTWKLRALDVLAELEVKGTITTKRIREIGVDPRRWIQNRWLLPGERRGDWVRGDTCPRFDEQHPTAYAVAVEKAVGSGALLR